MRPKIPADAFERYVALGAGRTYQALAASVGVSKRTVVRRALAERWQERLVQVEQEGRAKAEARLTESVAAVTERHLRTLRAVQGKALQALTSAPLGTASQAAATLIAAVRAERAIVAPNEAADRGPSHAERLEAASKIPQEVVDAANDAYEQIRLREAAEKSQAPPAPELPPPVVARPFGEN